MEAPGDRDLRTEETDLGGDAAWHFVTVSTKAVGPLLGPGDCALRPTAGEACRLLRPWRRREMSINDPLSRAGLAPLEVVVVAPPTERAPPPPPRGVTPARRGDRDVEAALRGAATPVADVGNTNGVTAGGM